jgi:hypothetical protein
LNEDEIENKFQFYKLIKIKQIAIKRMRTKSKEKKLKGCWKKLESQTQKLRK